MIKILVVIGLIVAVLAVATVIYLFLTKILNFFS